MSVAFTKMKYNKYDFKKNGTFMCIIQIIFTGRANMPRVTFLTGFITLENKTATGGE